MEIVFIFASGHFFPDAASEKPSPVIGWDDFPIYILPLFEEVVTMLFAIFVFDGHLEPGVLIACVVDG